MSLATLNELLDETCSIAGLVCLGWEEVQAFIEASEQAQTPIALMVGPGARAYMPLEIWAKMFIHKAEKAKTKIAIHLDHGASLDEVKLALDLGFTSVMYDGSRETLETNIKITSEMVKLAKQYGASSEGEIGFVGYANGEKSAGTNPEEAGQFARDTDVGFMAVSVGNVHLQTTADAEPDWNRLDALAKIERPLVIHGGSGFSAQTRIKMARDYNVKKFNIGTELRQIYGKSLRQTFVDDENIFDHLTLSKSVHQPLVSKAQEIINNLKE